MHLSPLLSRTRLHGMSCSNPNNSNNPWLLRNKVRSLNTQLQEAQTQLTSQDALLSQQASQLSSETAKHQALLAQFNEKTTENSELLLKLEKGRKAQETLEEEIAVVKKELAELLTWRQEAVGTGQALRAARDEIEQLRVEALQTNQTFAQELQG